MGWDARERPLEEALSELGLVAQRTDGRGAGAGVQMASWEEEMSLVTRYPVLLQRVRVTTCLIGWGVGRGKNAQDLQEISPEWERTDPGVSGYKKLARFQYTG